MAALLLTAHMGWLITLWEERLSKPFPTLTNRFWLLMAAATPIQSFYAVLLVDDLEGRRSPRPATAWWRWLLPVGSVAAVFGATTVLVPRPGVASFDFPFILPDFLWQFAYFLIVTGIIHMTATVFGLTRRGPLTSRSQLLPAGGLAAMSLLAIGMA